MVLYTMNCLEDVQKDQSVTSEIEPRFLDRSAPWPSHYIDWAIPYPSLRPAWEDNFLSFVKVGIWCVCSCEQCKLFSVNLDEDIVLLVLTCLQVCKLHARTDRLLWNESTSLQFYYLLYTASIHWVIVDRWTGKYLLGSGRGSSRSILAILAGHVPNTSLQRYRYANLLDHNSC
jgi:hypothetical protein